MNIINTTALSNFKKNKSRNVLIGVAIVLTALLLTVVPTVLMGMISIQNKAVNNVYPTFHGMYRNVDSKAAKELQENEDMEIVGFRQDPAYVYCENPDISISMVYVDRNTAKMSKMELAKGEFPKKADEIVVSRGLLEVMGLNGEIGDRLTLSYQPVENDGLGAAQTKEFTITGMTADSKESAAKGVYSAMISEAFIKETLPEEAIKYRVYFRLKNTEGMVTDVIEDKIRSLGEEYGVRKDDIVFNGDYLMANYVDPATYAGLTMILGVIVLAGILTIYSIYYVSMMDKVQEYGKLRAIGATKRQIRQLVLREGLAVAAVSIPIGVIVGLVVGIAIVHGMIRTGFAADNMLAKQMQMVIKNHEVSLVKSWVIVLAAMISLVTAYISLLRPMIVASKISPIEAIRYQGNDKMKKRERKGREAINTIGLTKSNLGRNKRRTIITIFTLGMTGILYMVVATVLSCVNPDAMASGEIRKNIRISVDSWEGDEMHPERSLSKIQQNNPMTEELKGQIEAVDGVESVEEGDYVHAGLEEAKEDDGRPLQTGIIGIGNEAMEELQQYVVEGSLDAQGLKDGNGVIVGRALEESFPEGNWKVGDKVHVEMMDGDDTIRKELTIEAVVDAPISLAGYYLSMPNEVLQSMCSVNITDRYDIEVASGKEDSAAKAIEKLLADQEFLEMDTYQHQYEIAEMSIGYMRYGCYGMLVVFGLIGILNLINTMINSVFVRRKELGMLQAIGMSDRQMMKMLQMEGLFYTMGTLILALGVGSMAGYGCFLWAKEEKILSIISYSYPRIPAVVLAVVVLAVQLLVTYLVNKSFRKQSLIERIRDGGF